MIQAMTPEFNTNMMTLLNYYLKNNYDDEDTIENYKNVMKDTILTLKDETKQHNIIEWYKGSIKDGLEPDEIIDSIVYEFFL